MREYDDGVDCRGVKPLMQSFRLLTLGVAGWLLVSLGLGFPQRRFTVSAAVIIWLGVGLALIGAVAASATRPGASSSTDFNDRVMVRFFVATVAVSAYPLVFSIGLSRWRSDPSGSAWIAYVVTFFLAVAMSLVLAGAAGWTAVTAHRRPNESSSGRLSLRRLIGSTAVLAIGLPVAAVIGLAAGLAGWSCSGGVIGEGCGGGSQITGVAVGAVGVIVVGLIAAAVGRSRATAESTDTDPTRPEVDVMPEAEDRTEGDRMADAAPAGVEMGFCPACGILQFDEREDCFACGEPLPRTTSDGGRTWLPWFVASVAVAVAIVGIVIAVTRPSDGNTDAGATTTVLRTTSTTTTTMVPTTVSVPGQPTGFDNAELAARYGDAVFLIGATGCGSHEFGSGFAIDEYHIVTSRLVVATDMTPLIIDRSGEQLTGRVIGWQEIPDVAVLEVGRPIESWLDWVESDLLAEGQRLITLGYPSPTHNFSVVPGTIVSFATAGNHRMAIRTDAPLDLECLGGPSLVADGRAAGFVTGGDVFSDGPQPVPIIATADSMAVAIGQILEYPTWPTVDCSEVIDAPPTEPTTTTTAPPPSYEHPNPPFYTVVTASMGTAESTYEDALARAGEIEATYRLGADYGVDSAVLLSDDFSSLTDGYWVVYTGVWYDREYARGWADYLRAAGCEGCYAKQVTW